MSTNMQKQVYEYVEQHYPEKILRWQICPISGEEFPIYEKDRQLLDALAPQIDGIDTSLPDFSLGFIERRRKILAWRNNRNFYRRSCDLTKKPIISIYAPDNGYTVYHQDARASDAWDPLSYGQEIDRTRPFFAQFDELMHKVPRPSMLNVQTENSEYCNYIKDAKNCYMSSIVYYDSEDIFYSQMVNHSKYCGDCVRLDYCELCYKCIDSTHLYRCDHLLHCHYSERCRFSANLRNCKNCLCCHNLNNKQYCIFNKQYTKEQRTQEVNRFFAQSDRYDQAKKQFEKILHDRIIPAMNLTNCTNVMAEPGIDSEDVLLSAFITNTKNARYSYCLNSQDCMQMTGGTMQMSYQSTNVGWGSFVIGCASCYDCSYMYHCDICQDNCLYCFGCIGLRNKQYCIFNKQYTKEERFPLVGKLITHMKSTGERGEFFPIELSPFGYNEAWVQDYFPLTKEETLVRGYSWSDRDMTPFTGEGYTPLPIEQYDAKAVGTQIAQKNVQDLLQGVIVCRQSGRGFKVVSGELELYSRLGMPIPTMHPELRYQQGTKLLAGREFFVRTCDKTGRETLSAYPQGYPGKVRSVEAYEEMME